MPLAVLGADGQVGRALCELLPDSRPFDRTALDVTDAAAVAAIDWSGFDAIVNAAAYTAVDKAETTGRTAAWRVNATGVANLAAAARRHDRPLVQFSSEYVFDGTARGPIGEDEPACPIGWYGATKAAGDLAAAAAPRHLVLRTSWVVGDGANFVRTMVGLARRGISPGVVDDQIGRLTFADDLAAATVRLLAAHACGTYNVTNSGESGSWADVAAAVFDAVGEPGTHVTPVTTEAYFADKPAAAPRPRNSVLDLAKAQRVGVEPPPWRTRLTEYVEKELTS